jgi:hypothetical protein
MSYARRPVGRFFARGGWPKGRNCYWNIVSNMERGALIRSAFPRLAHVVASKVADTNLALFWRRAKRKPLSV